MPPKHSLELFHFRPDAELVAAMRALYDLERPETQLLALARALAHSPWWGDVEEATVVVRAAPEPTLGIVGRFDEASRARMDGLTWQLGQVLPRSRFVGYPQAEAACQELEAKLMAHLGPDKLHRARFVAIPRGGHIVLGMLAYALGLRRAQLEPSTHENADDAPLVVVDDCSLSGVRFGQFVKQFGDRHIIFAHLYSHPRLREAIEAREPNVVTCLSARDLHDFAPEKQGENYPAWRERWTARLEASGYWVGQTEHICFAWNEPDTVIWNRVTEQEEGGWQLLPPERCLKNRATPNSAPARVQVQREGKGPLKPSNQVIFAELDDRVVAGNLATGESLCLIDVAADMWQMILEQGSEPLVVAKLGEMYEVEEIQLAADMSVFVRDLLARGFLMEEDGPNAAE